MTFDAWPVVHAERAALVQDLASLDDAQWDVPSLCAGWSVHDVAAHLVDTARTTRTGFVLGLARARFDFDRQNAAGVVRWRGRTPQETLDRLREVVTRTTTPPAPLASRIVEEVVHGEDVRRPLGPAPRLSPGRGRGGAATAGPYTRVLRGWSRAGHRPAARPRRGTGDR
jgi:uncharacterized protein (TIGR03083 family)